MKNDVKKILVLLEAAVEKDDKKKQQLNEDDLLHVAMHTWEEIEHASHEWHVSRGEVLKLVTAALFGAAVVKYDLAKIWFKLVKMSVKKAKLILKATAIINSAKNYKDAIASVQRSLGIKVPSPQQVPALAEARRLRKLKIKESVDHSTYHCFAVDTKYNIVRKETVSNDLAADAYMSINDYNTDTSEYLIAIASRYNNIEQEVVARLRAGQSAEDIAEDYS